MLILTIDNNARKFDHSTWPEDGRYCVYDHAEKDIFFIPVVGTQFARSPVHVLQIGSYTVEIPYRGWISIGDPECGDIDMLAAHDIGDQPAWTPVFNPFTSYLVSWLPIRFVETVKHGGGTRAVQR